MLSEKGKTRWKLSVAREKKFGCELRSNSLRAFATASSIVAQKSPRLRVAEAGTASHFVSVTARLLNSRSSEIFTVSEAAPLIEVCVMHFGDDVAPLWEWEKRMGAMVSQNCDYFSHYTSPLTKQCDRSDLSFVDYLTNFSFGGRSRMGYTISTVGKHVVKEGTKINWSHSRLPEVVVA